MNTLLALSAPQSIHAFRQNSIWMRSGYAALFVSSAKHGSGIEGLLAQQLQRPDFGTSSILLLKVTATAIHSLRPSFVPVPTPSLTVLFPCVKQRQG